MSIAYYAQRKHIIHSLEQLLYQLHTLSFLLQPSLVAFAIRCATQTHLSRAREWERGPAATGSRLQRAIQRDSERRQARASRLGNGRSSLFRRLALARARNSTNTTIESNTTPRPISGNGDAGRNIRSVGGESQESTRPDSQVLSGGATNSSGDSASNSSHPIVNERGQGGEEASSSSNNPATETGTTDTSTETTSPVVPETLPGSRTGKKRLLLHYIVSVLLFNVTAIWSHLTVHIPAEVASRSASATSSAGKNEMAKTIVLDFVGIGRHATRFQLLLLDATIIFLQLVLTTIAFETTVVLNGSAEPDALLPIGNDETSESSDIEYDTEDKDGVIAKPDLKGKGKATNTYTDKVFLRRAIYPASESGYNGRSEEEDDENQLSRLLPSTSTTSAGRRRGKKRASSFLDTRRDNLTRPLTTVRANNYEVNPLVIDLRFAHFMHRLLTPSPDVGEDNITTSANDTQTEWRMPGGTAPDPTPNSVAEMRSDAQEQLNALLFGGLPFPNTTRIGGRRIGR